MIGWLEGKVLEVGEETLLLAVQGVGYELIVGSNVASAQSKGQEISLYTHLLIKQDGLDLYGFESILMREIFRRLMQVSSVGGKSALAIIATLSPAEIVQSIQVNDPKMLARAPGIGNRVATRIITDLNGKLEDLPIGDGTPESEDMKTKQMAIEALVTLSYTRQQAGTVVNSAWVEGISVEELIRRALQRIGI